MCDQISHFTYLALGPARGEIGVGAARNLELVAAAARHGGELPGAQVGDLLAHRGGCDFGGRSVAGLGCRYRAVPRDGVLKRTC